MNATFRQRGAATLLFLLLAALALLAATASVLYTVKSSQKLQYAEHTATQAQANAWNGVNLVSGALFQLAGPLVNNPTGANGSLAGTLTANAVGVLPDGGVAFRGADPTTGYLVFDVTGTSAGASSTLRVAYNTATSVPGSSALNNSMTFTGATTIGGSLQYQSSDNSQIQVNINGTGKIVGGASISGISTVCASQWAQGSNSSLQTGPANPPNCGAVLSFSAAQQKANASYVFTVVNGSPYYQIQNMSTGNMASPAPLTTTAAAALCGSSSCLSFSNGTWNLKSWAYSSSGGVQSGIPGVLWFDGGALSVGAATSGSSTTIEGTLVSTGDVNVANGVSLYAFNALDPQYNSATPLSQGPCASTFSMRSANLCPDVVDSKGIMPLNGLGNVAIMAGQNFGSNLGGNVNLSPNDGIFGAVMAGGLLNYTGGGHSVNITGPIYTAGANIGSNNNDVQGSVVVHQITNSALGTVPTQTINVNKNNIVWVSPI